MSPPKDKSWQRQTSTNISQVKPNISRSLREKHNGHKAFVIWLTGLSGAGKSTLASRLEKHLFKQGYQTALLDGDLLRHGLCGDLDFSKKDRNENIRRASELSRLFFEQGHIVCCAFISPRKAQREYARMLIPKGRFFEIHAQCDLDTLIERDPKGLYKKAISHRIPNFTGVTAPYEVPENPEICIDTARLSIPASTNLILDYLRKKKMIEFPQ